MTVLEGKRDEGKGRGTEGRGEGGREGERDRGKGRGTEGRGEGGREGEREGGKGRGTEGRGEGQREGEREGGKGREGERDRGKGRGTEGRGEGGREGERDRGKGRGREGRGEGQREGEREGGKGRGTKGKRGSVRFDKDEVGGRGGGSQVHMHGTHIFCEEPLATSYSESLSCGRCWNHLGASLTTGLFPSSTGNMAASPSSRNWFVSSLNSVSTELTILRRLVSTRAWPICVAAGLGEEGRI